ncbi:hypothetical protein CYMTET_5179 [Cymbomonas tetramitiformis]|uniref:Uncharacterized protein n=1 Tax=Cymbomonas tetramitiformis TaxID=36881 RepID=A0AAE0LJ60_9CHLO|nr:hypothetical protein CYMTET_5179 [Cymbomonas tetramitiformis]
MDHNSRARRASKAWARVVSKRRDRGVYARRRIRGEQLARSLAENPRAAGYGRFGHTDFAYWRPRNDGEPDDDGRSAPDLRVQITRVADGAQYDALLRRKRPDVEWPSADSFVTLRSVRGRYADVGTKVTFAVRTVRCGSRANVAECAMIRVGQ